MDRMHESTDERPVGSGSDPVDAAGRALVEAALLMIVRDSREAGLRALERLRGSTDAEAAAWAALELGVAARDDGDFDAAVELFREVERHGRTDLPELGLSLAHAWGSVGHPACSERALQAVYAQFSIADPRTYQDPQRRRVASLAAYRLGELAFQSGIYRDAVAYWMEALHAGDEDVSPHAARDLAMRVGPRLLFPAQIEELLRLAIYYDHPTLSVRAAFELGCVFAAREQHGSAAQCFRQVARSEDPELGPKALKALEHWDEDRHVFTDLDVQKLSGAEVELNARRFSSTSWPRRSPSKRVLIVGAGTGGQYLLDSLQRGAYRHEVCGFLDDEATNVPTAPDIEVLGPISELSKWIEHVDPDEVLMAIPTASGRKREEVVLACRAAEVSLRNLPSMHELLRVYSLVPQLRDVRIEETIGSERVYVDREALHQFLDRSVMIVGAATACGAELARKLAHADVRHLALLDHADDALSELHRELTGDRGFPRVAAVLGEYADEASISRELHLHAPSVVFHAGGAARRSLIDANILAGVYNDVVCAPRVARAAVNAGVERFVYVSSNHAAYPETPFGALKALAEAAVLDVEPNNERTKALVVRIGSLFRAPGSVVPVFERQIQLGGPVTVGDPTATRRFLLGPRAAELLLHATWTSGYDRLLALDAGETIPILELAHRMIRLAGLSPGWDVEIQQTPQQRGGRDTARFVAPHESVAATVHDEIVSITSTGWETVADLCHELERTVEEHNPVRAHQLLISLPARLADVKPRAVAELADRTPARP